MQDGQVGAVVVADDVTRRYGEGDTAVDALRGVSLEVAKGKLTAVMGPSGSGKSTLMHILAGLDKPTSGDVVDRRHDDHDAARDNELTKLRRKHIGFVFQFFNLLPMLTAEENILLPLSIAGEKPDRAWFRELDRQGRPRGPAQPPSRGALGWTAAARRDRARARLQADGRLRRRADRQPRLGDERRDPRADARLGRRPRADDRDGDARSSRGRDRRPHPLPRRRADRARRRRPPSTHDVIAGDGGDLPRE